MKKLLLIILLLPTLSFADEVAFQCKMKWEVGTGIYQDTRLINTDWVEELYKYDKKENKLVKDSIKYSCVTDDDKLMCDQVWKENDSLVTDYIHIHRKTLALSSGRVVSQIKTQIPTDTFLYEGKCQIVENQF